MSVIVTDPDQTLVGPKKVSPVQSAWFWAAKRDRGMTPSTGTLVVYVPTRRLPGIESFTMRYEALPFVAPCPKPTKQLFASSEKVMSRIDVATHPPLTVSLDPAPIHALPWLMGNPASPVALTVDGVLVGTDVQSGGTQTPASVGPPSIERDPNGGAPGCCALALPPTEGVDGEASVWSSEGDEATPPHATTDNETDVKRAHRTMRKVRREPNAGSHAATSPH
jgi:hypothetical protein